MYSRYDYYRGEAREMAKCILKGSSVEQTAKKFDTSKETVRRRLQLLNLKAEELVEIREAKKQSRKGRLISAPFYINFLVLFN